MKIKVRMFFEDFAVIGALIVAITLLEWIDQHLM